MSPNFLRYTVRRAYSDADLRAACRVRATSYGHHLPNVAGWTEPDELDRHPDTAVFVAFAKDTGEPVGTVRVATNVTRTTQIERSAPIPPTITERGVIAEVTRLSVLPGHPDPSVKLGLMKSIYLHCMAHQVQWMVIGARSDSLVRQYLRLGFTDVFDPKTLVPLAHAGNLPHRVLAFDVTSAERNWHAMSHPFYDFMVRMYHPDIQLFTAPAVQEAAATGQPAEPARVAVSA